MHMWLVCCGGIPRLIISFALNGSFAQEIYIVSHCARVKRFQNGRNDNDILFSVLLEKHALEVGRHI